MFNKDHVNKRNSRTWIRLNEDAKSGMFREKFIQQFGGKFVKEGRYWKWLELDFEKMFLQEIEEKVKEFKIPEPVIKVERGKSFVFTKNGEEVYVKNLLEFCMDNKLVRGAMYDLMSGKRKTYKGYKFLRKEE
jgi:hypothetical protein